MSAPKRIQMTRQRPWRAEHPDAVIVARPSKWGNGFRVERVPGGWSVSPDPHVFESRTAARAHAVALFRYVHARGLVLPDADDARRELAGRDLACWCPLDQQCHADVLLEIANGADS